MPLNIHTKIKEVPAELPITYFTSGYFQSQVYNQFVGYSDKDFFIPFDITQEKAISIPRSPFGSFFSRNNTKELSSSFLDKLCADLSRKDVLSMELRHPSSIYDSFVSSNCLETYGFNTAYVDVNQHIELKDDWQDSIHTMQKRKLESLRKESFEFRKMRQEEFETAHKFLAVCRQAQGLQINISWNQLKNLMEQLPNTYECFGVFRNEKISALCITVNVTADIAYYYLPATSPMFRDKSPMVMLIAGIVEYYSSKGYRYLDLGVSSFQGRTQETLKIFKERMGAQSTDKPTLNKSL